MMPTWERMIGRKRFLRAQSGLHGDLWRDRLHDLKSSRPFISMAVILGFMAASGVCSSLPGWGMDGAS